MELLKMNDEQLVAKIVKDFEAAENAKQPYQDRWKEYYRLYKSRIDPAKKRVGSNLFIPYTWAQVEQLKARVWQSLFGHAPYINFAANNPVDVDGSKVMEDLVFWQMKEKIKLPVKFINALTSIFIYGTAIALDEWKFTERNIKKRKPIFDPNTNIKMGEEIASSLVTVYDDPNIDFIPVDDFFPDPESWDIESGRFNCIRVYRDKEYLQKKAKEIDPITGKPKYILPEGYENDSGGMTINFRDDINGLPVNKSPGGTDRSKDKELIVYYTNEAKITVLNQKYIIAKEENKNYDDSSCFTRIVAFDQEKEFWGLPITEVLEHLQHELNTNRNQRIDNVALVLNRMWKKRRDADIDNSQLVSKAGNIIVMDDITGDLDYIDTPDVTSSAYQEENIIKQDMQYISAVNDYARGATPQRKETATTVNTLVEASNIVFNYMSMMIETTGLIPIADRIKKLNQQYVTQEKIFRLFDSAKGAWQFNTANPDQIQGDYDAVSASPRLESQKTKEARRDQLMAMFDKFMSNPTTAQYINAYEAIVMIMKSFDIEDYEKMLIDPSKMQPGQPQIDTATGQPIQPQQPPMQPTPEQMTMLLGGVPNAGL